MDKRAKAFATYGEAAVLDLLVKVLPEIVRSASEPLSNVDKISIISTEGASDLSRTVAANVAQGLEMGSDLTGVDIRALLGKLGGAAGAGTVEKPAPAAPGNGRPAPIDINR